MNGLVADGTMKEWLPLAYDWRFSPEKVLNDGIKTKTETLDVINKIEQLATSSKTGKVTIVMHSMGGLLGKAIIKKLQDEGKDNLIDSFVMVGTPQLGTPQAVASILHGDDEGIAAGFIVNPIGIRRIAQNMPSAYNLLPSPRYFTEVSDPVVTFDSNAPFTQAWRDFWGTTINTYSSFLSFITGTGVTRVKPIETELKDPEVLRPELMTNAFDFHNQYDNYQFPEHIRVVQVAGWGSPTTKSVEYKTYHGYPNYETKFTIEGDRAVVYQSAVSSVADETYFFDIGKYRKNTNSSTQHRDLLSAGPVETLLMSVVKNEKITESNFTTSTKPQVTNVADQMIVSTHSPVILGAYDQLGNFTGVDPNQNLSADILSIKENIPGSTFLYTSESQNIFLPKEGNYNFIYKGIGEGPTTVTIKNFVADVTTQIASYTDIPTTTSTVATFTVQSAAPENTIIALDANGDGTIEKTLKSTPELQITFNTNTKNVILSAQDTIDPSPSIVTTKSSATLTNAGGNTTVIPFTQLRENLTTLKFSYNKIIRNGITTTVPNTNILYDWQETKGVLTGLNTKITVRGVEKYVFSYRKASNVTIIKETTNAGTITTTKPGFVVVTVKTDGSGLKVSY